MMENLTGTKSFTSKELYGVSSPAEDGADAECSCFHLENESGNGDIRVYRVFSGV